MRADRHLFRISIVVAMLLGGVPALRHSHPGGERPHSHEHEHHGEHHAHLHVTLFGVGFTLPAESDDEDSEEGRTTFLVASPIVVDMGQSAAHTVAQYQAVDHGTVLPFVPRFRCKTAIAAPLCDAARLERTGVLLA